MKTCYFCKRVLVHEPFTIATISWATGWTDQVTHTRSGDKVIERLHELYTELAHIDCVVQAVRAFGAGERAVGGAA